MQEIRVWELKTSGRPGGLFRWGRQLKKSFHTVDGNPAPPWIWLKPLNPGINHLFSQPCFANMDYVFAMFFCCQVTFAMLVAWLHPKQTMTILGHPSWGQSHLHYTKIWWIYRRYGIISYNNERLWFIFYYISIKSFSPMLIPGVSKTHSDCSNCSVLSTTGCPSAKASGSQTTDI